MYAYSIKLLDLADGVSEEELVAVPGGVQVRQPAQGQREHVAAQHEHEHEVAETLRGCITITTSSVRRGIM